MNHPRSFKLTSWVEVYDELIDAGWSKLTARVDTYDEWIDAGFEHCSAGQYAYQSRCLLLVVVVGAVVVVVVVVVVVFLVGVVRCLGQRF